MLDELIIKEVDRIKEIAKDYLKLKSLLPGYESDYLDAYVELANRFDSCNLDYGKGND